MDDLRLEVNKAGRLEIILSQRINKKNRTAANEINEPIEEIAFQVVYASG
jgi:hypothetical protein